MKHPGHFPRALELWTFSYMSLGLNQRLGSEKEAARKEKTKIALTQSWEQIFAITTE